MSINMDTHKNNTLKVVLTGGHGSTQGIAVSEELKTRYPEAKLYWIGSKYAIPGSRVTTPEYKLFPEIGVEFYSLIVGKVQTKFTRYTIPLLLNIPLSFIQALFLIIKLRPKLIISFGGFSSFPVIFWGWVMRIPVILHEQTVVAGRASILSAYLATIIAVSRNESKKYFPQNKIVVTGNPIMEEVLAINPKLKIGKIKNILVIGGSRGSEFINDEISKALPRLLEKYRITLVTGEANFNRYKGLSSNFLKVIAYADPKRIRPALYEDCDLIISRAGASTVSEILYIKRPAILIPLPRTFMNEQYKNAEYAEDFGIAKVMTEEEVASGHLSKAVDEIFLNWGKIVSRVSAKPSPDLGATQKIVDVVEKYI